MVSYPAAEMAGRSVHDLHAYWTSGAVEQDAIGRKLADGRPIRTYETAMVTPDGRDLEVSASIAPLRDETGRVNGNGAGIRMEISGEIIPCAGTQAGTGAPAALPQQCGERRAEEFRARTFEPFFTTKPLGQGTGLGLSLCRDIVAGHGGVIRVAPALRGGAVFTVQLPIGVGDDPEDQVYADEALRSLPSQLVLVVDDEPSVLSLIKDVLTADGHKVETASDGRVALSRLAEIEFDVVVSDIRMPEVDGRTLHREIERLNPDLVRRMVLLTGDTLSPETIEFLGQAGRPILFKPFTIDDLRRAVRAARTGARPDE